MDTDASDSPSGSELLYKMDRKEMWPMAYDQSSLHKSGKTKDSLGK